MSFIYLYMYMYKDFIKTCIEKAMEFFFLHK